MRYTATYLFVFLFAASLVYIWILRGQIKEQKRHVVRISVREEKLLERYDSRSKALDEVIDDLQLKLRYAYRSLEEVLNGCQSNIKGVEAQIGPDGLSGVSYEFHTNEDKEEANL